MWTAVLYSDMNVGVSPPYLVDYVFVVADVVLEGHDGIPGVVLGVHAAAGGLAVFVTSHSQGIPEER